MKVIAADTEDAELLLIFNFPPLANVDYIADKVRMLVGVGNPFFAFHNSAITPAIANNPAWDPAGAPLVSDNQAANAAHITAMLADAALQTLPNDKVFTAG